MIAYLCRVLPLAFLCLTAAPLLAQTAASQSLGDTGDPLAGFRDYREGAGHWENGAWRVRLTAHETQWQPRGENGPNLKAYAFSTDDGAPRVPAPMIRVSMGTPVEVTVTNRLDRTLVLRGLTEWTAVQTAGPTIPPAFREESLRLEPGETGTVRFTPEQEGSFLYYARTLPVYGPIEEEVFGGEGPDSQLIGPLIVDSPGEAPSDNEQVVLITRWADREFDPSSWEISWKMMLNGRSWPATERLSYTVGDTVTWRVINASLQSHPMHLHGFFFRVDARGDQIQDTTFAPAERRMAVTETLGGLGETMRLTWVPETPGNWLFHCHLIRHMSSLQRIADEPRLEEHGASVNDHAEEGMAGMIMGIHVRPRPGEMHAEAPVERKLDLYTGRRDRMIGDDPAYSFVLQEGTLPPAVDSVSLPSSPLILTRDEMTEIMVHNRLEFPFGVHWHGLELASRYDGVADWSGMPGQAVPPIAPGDSFAVRIAPPRAGTFIYHVHSEPGQQLAQGMYGAFLVLEPGERYHPEHDRVFVLGSEGTDIQTQMPVINGERAPEPLEFRAGETYRLRFINISTDDVKELMLLSEDEPESDPERWRLIAKDGAALPASQVEAAPAVQEIHVGETYDVLWTPDGPGTRTLEIYTGFYGADGRDPHKSTTPVVVR